MNKSSFNIIPVFRKVRHGAISANLGEIGVLPSLIDLYDDNIRQIASAVVKIHGSI